MATVWSEARQVGPWGFALSQGSGDEEEMASWRELLALVNNWIDLHRAGGMGLRKIL